MWRKRIQGRVTKQQKLRIFNIAVLNTQDKNN